MGCCYVNPEVEVNSEKGKKLTDAPSFSPVMAILSPINDGRRCLSIV